MVALVLLMAAGLCSNVRAQDIVQEVHGQLLSVDPIGQSFVAPEGNIHLQSISFFLADNYQNEAVTMVLREGEGFDGEEIATRTREGLTNDHDETWLSFDFTGVSLVPGATYTFAISGESNPMLVAIGSREPGGYYPDGQLLHQMSDNTGNSDLAFRVELAACYLSEGGESEAIRVECTNGTSFTFLHPLEQGAVSCSVTDHGDGSATIECEDGSSADVRGSSGADGQDGVDGQDGMDGMDGADGTSCTVIDREDGRATIECEDGSSVVLGRVPAQASSDAGAAGQGAGVCSVEELDGGGAIIECPDGTSAQIAGPGTSAGGGGGCSAGGASGGVGGMWLVLWAVGVLVYRRRCRPASYSASGAAR